MPEIKHQFTGGKMNKDLDERLVPNGQYRDAMNIQVSTSESSEVGTAQNVLGNELKTIVNSSGIAYDLPPSAVTIGAIADEKNDTLYYLVWTPDIDYIISYNGVIHTMVFVDKTKEVLKFANCTIITGINVIDDMLFWTDNINEPRKINIPRCIQGTSWLGTVPNQTELYNTATGVLTEIKEEHITVIRKGPQYSLDMVMKTHRSPELIYTGVIKIFSNDEPWDASASPAVGSSFIGESFDNGIFDFSSTSTDPGDNEFSVEILTALDNTNTEIDLLTPPPPPGTGTLERLTGWHNGGSVNSILGRKVVLQAYKDDGTGTFVPPSVPLTDFVIKGEIIEVLSDIPAIPPSTTPTPQSNSQSGVGTNYGVKIKVTTVDGFPEQPEDGVQLKYIIDIFEETEKLFEFKFPRFSHRYKYGDGEYSTFAPFTQVAFLPGAFDYHPRKGYNLGMTNKIRQVELFNIITTDTPKDVVAIDILFKDDSSPNVYVVDTIKPDDWAPPNDSNLWNKLLQSSQNPTATPFGLVIDKEAINSVVPSNQLLRPWDNVPKKALGQDVTGNRIVYANYVQNYDLLSLNGKNYVPNLNVSMGSFSSDDNLVFNSGTNIGANAYKSIKSLREYQLGVVFIDEFGRETPVLSNTSSTHKIEKDLADTANRFQVQFDSDDFPQALTHFKFFVKETSSEYYNLAMDRFYSAGDGNLWLSFPSSDRNKVDIDTFLIMKKGTDQDALVTDAARYKIIAIENEAPDFIKTTKRKLVSLKNGGVGLFTNPSDMPFAGSSEFNIRTQSLYGTAGQNIDNITDSELWVEFERTGTPQISDRYKIVGVTNSHVDKTSSVTTHEFAFKLDRPLQSDVNFISNDPSGLTSNDIENTAIVNIYKYTVENLDKFDGRFFVKIYFDDTFKQNIVADSSGGGLRRVAYRKVYLLDEELVAKHTTDLQRFATRGRGYSRDSITSGWSGRKFYGGGGVYVKYGYYVVDEFMANALYFRRYREKEYGQGGSNAIPPNYGVSGQSTPAYTSLNADGYRALIHLSHEAEDQGVDNLDGSPWIPYKDGYWKDTKDWWKEFGYNTHAQSSRDRDGGRTGASSYGVTSGWKRHFSELGEELSGWDRAGNFWTSGHEVQFSVKSYIEYTQGYESDRDSAKDTDVWFIDKGPSEGIYNDQDSTATLSFNRSPLQTPSLGNGLVINGATWNIDLGFGGIIPNSGSGTNLWDGKENVPGFWDVGDWNEYNDTPANSNYFDEGDFATRINSGYQLQWDEDNSNDGAGTQYIVGGTVDSKNMFRHSDGRHLKHYHGDGSSSVGGIHAVNHSTGYNNEEYSTQTTGSHEPNDLHSMAEGLSFNMSKRWELKDIEPALVWDPTSGGQPNIINGGLVIDASVALDFNGNSIGSSSTVEGPQKQDDLVIFVDSLKQVINNVQKSLHEGMALTAWTSGGSVIDLETTSINAKFYVVREIQTITGGGGNPDYFKLLLGGYTQPFQQAEHDFLYVTNPPDVGTTYTFKQVGMNGYSPNSEFNINTIARPSGSSVWGAVGAVGYTLSWYDTLEESEIMSENPAIFETEPKDMTELDIYYEASGSVPTVINDDTIASALPIGTKFEFVGETYTVMGYNNSQLLIQGSAAPTFGPVFGPAAWEKFFRPDDLIIELKITHFGTTPTPGDWTVTIGDQVVIPNNKFILPWHNCYTFRNGVESNRIRDNYNLPYISNGVKASTTLEQEYREEHRKYGLIYSGIYNSVSGINNLNQFIQAEKITKDINPIYGSIQKLHSRDSDLVTLCEDKILRISANKDAVYNADGNPQLIATDRVLGQTIPFSGEYGISTNPESFASEAYRSYFSDKIRGAVLRLSKDGLTPISDFGMKDWFRDNLRLTRKIIGSYDDRNQEYNVKLQMDSCVDVPFIGNVIPFCGCKHGCPPYSATAIYQFYDVVEYGGLNYSYQGPPGVVSPPPPDWNWMLCPGQDSETDPCEGYPGNLSFDYEEETGRCCGKCDQWIIGDPDHPCHDFCIQWRDCCCVDCDTSNATSFDLSTVYFLGDVVLYQGNYYHCTAQGTAGVLPDNRLGSKFELCCDSGGCTDPLALNYDPSAVNDDGSCIYGIGNLPLSPHNFGVSSPNELPADGEVWEGNAPLGQESQICAYPPSPGSPVYGGHMTKNYYTGFQHQGSSVYTESHYWNIGGLSTGQTYKISWKEIVLSLRRFNSCSDCLMGGWAIRTDAIQAPWYWGTPVSLLGVWIDYPILHQATPLYDPVTGLGGGALSYALPGYHQSNCNQNTSATATNTAGAPNGSESIWHDRCTTFTATAPTMRIHFIAFTDFNQCTDCHGPVLPLTVPPQSAGTKHGAYVGLSEVSLISGSC